MAPIIQIHHPQADPLDPMDPHGHHMEAPMSRTHQYRKVMKPLLERKRRARINKCLDDLKDLMVFAMQSEGESITKLEKADVLELTVRHLQKLKRQQQLQIQPGLDVDRYTAGYSACANEVSRFIVQVNHSAPTMNTFGTSLMNHLSRTVPASPAQAEMRPKLSVSPVCSLDGGYNSGRDSNSPSLSVGAPSPKPASNASTVWRPF